MQITWPIHAQTEYHPNRVGFNGVLTILDKPSTKSPSGARGHRVVLQKEAAEAALPGLIGMAIDFNVSWDGHDPRSKCGVITHAEIEGQKLIVSGHLYGRDFPDVIKKLSQADSDMGMSYEIADAHITDMRASIWRVNRAYFTGAAILQRTKAAYQGTSFQLDCGDRTVAKKGNK